MGFAQRWIGRGSYSDVYELINHDPPAVLKSIHCSTKEQRKDYEKEYETLKELKHPNIIGYIRSEQIDEYRFGIVMEYCRLGSLKMVILNPTITYTVNTVICWSKQVFEAVDYMYREYKVIHRDIKPENIFVADTWILKIGDFGSTRIIEKTCTGTFAGTQRYMSPPQFDRNKKGWGQMETSLQDSHRNDVYSLGLTLWEMIERRCTNFDRSLRPSAREILTMLANLQEKHQLIAEFEFLPQKDAKQKELHRPIGFNGKREMTLISESLNSQDFASFEDATVSQRSENFFRRNPEFIGEFDATLMCAYEEILAYHPSTYTDSLSEKLLSLYEEKKQQGYKFHEKDALKRELREKLANRKAWIEPIIVFLELWLLNDIYCQLECFSWFFEFLNSWKGYYLSPWGDYQMMGHCIRWLEELKAIRYTVPISFKRFFQKSTYQEWL